jgi:transketolase
MRTAFIEELVAAAKHNSKIVLVIGDLGYGVVETFRDSYPERFFNAGVAEQNMMGLAAGLASEGMHVFVYSIANFPTFRCAEQIRNDVAYHNLPVTIVSVGGGLAYGNLGYSHHAVQDYALLRTFPNLLIAAPGDPLETKACLRYLVDHPQPSYLRLGKAGEPNVHSKLPEIEPGKWVAVRKGDSDQPTYLTTGAALSIADKLIATDKTLDNCALYSLPLWGMHSKGLQSSQVEKFKKIITVEDHLLDGGFGSWMLESLLDRPELLSAVKVKALEPTVCGLVGRQAVLNEAGGLSLSKLCE